MKALYPRMGLARICGLFGVTRQAFYQHDWKVIETSVEHEIILDEVRRIRAGHPRMGVRKVYGLLWAKLIAHHIKTGRDALFDLFASHGLLVKRRKRKAYTTNSFHWLHKYPNLITHWQRTRPNEVWVSDITYWAKAEGFYYISLLTGAYSKKALGFKLATSLHALHTVEALKSALKTLAPKHQGLIHHSDRGVQYCCADYVKMLSEHHIKISMGEKGDPLENPMAERMNGILKDEYLSQTAPDEFAQAQQQLAHTVELYNGERPHLRCDMLTPNQTHQSEGKLERRWKNYY